MQSVRMSSWIDSVLAAEDTKAGIASKVTRLIIIIFGAHKHKGQTVGITEASPCYLSQGRCMPIYYSLESKVTCNNYAERNRVDSHHTDLLSIVSPLLT